MRKFFPLLTVFFILLSVFPQEKSIVLAGFISPVGAGGDFSVLVLDLVSGEEGVQESALKEFAQKVDPMHLPLLTALHEGALYRWIQPGIEDRVVILKTIDQPDGEEVSYLLDASMGTRLTEWDEYADDPPGEIERVSVRSSKGRRWLQAALDGIRLFGSSAGDRRAVATKLGNQGDPASLPMLRRALSVETNRWARHALQEAIQQIRVVDSDPEVRKDAARQLGQIHALQAFPLLKSLLSETPGEQDEGVRREIQASVKEIESFQARQQILGTIFSGLSLGSILLLMGLGLAIIFGLMGVINMAHGEMMMIGAYTAFVLQELFSKFFAPSYQDLYFIFALPLSFVVTGLVGLILEKSVIRFLYGRPLETLLATWGISLILQQAARWYFGDLTSVNAPTWMRGGVEVMTGLVFPYNRIFIMGLSLFVVIGVYLLIFRSPMGLRIRAVTQNRGMSACLGISTRRVDSWTFALGAGLAGLAGCALSLIGNVDPEMGKTYIVDSFMVVVVGGVGKLAGTIISAMGIGMLNKVLEPIIGGTGGAVYAKVLILAGIILFLQRKPSGLFPAKGRGAEE